MTKKEICLSNPAAAYYSGMGDVEVNKIEYGINDYMYITAGAWTGKKSFHRVKIQYTAAGDAFIKLHGYKMLLDDFIKM
jgi:hypothetical protein